MTAFITVYGERSADHCINVDHIVQVVKVGYEPPIVRLTDGSVIRVYATPQCPEPSPADERHQDILDQITAATRNGNPNERTTS
jgi:hypothetical protein